MEATIYKIEVDKKDILFFEELMRRLGIKILNKEEKPSIKTHTD